MKTTFGKAYLKLISSMTSEEILQDKQAQCDHDDICTDERCCLDCGKDMTEDLMAQAEHDAEINEER